MVACTVSDNEHSWVVYIYVCLLKIDLWNFGSEFPNINNYIRTFFRCPSIFVEWKRRKSSTRPTKLQKVFYYHLFWSIILFRNTNESKLFALNFRIYTAHYTLVIVWYSLLFYLIFIKYNIFGKIWEWTEFNNWFISNKQKLNRKFVSFKMIKITMRIIGICTFKPILDSVVGWSWKEQKSSLKLNGNITAKYLQSNAINLTNTNNIKDEVPSSSSIWFIWFTELPAKPVSTHWKKSIFFEYPQKITSYGR